MALLTLILLKNIRDLITLGHRAINLFNHCLHLSAQISRYSAFLLKYQKLKSSLVHVPP